LTELIKLINTASQLLMMDMYKSRRYDPDYWLEKISKLDPTAVDKIKNFFNEPENLLLSRSAKKNYVMSIYNLLRHTHKPLEEITPDDVKEYLNQRAGEGISNSTLFIEFTLIRKFLRYIGVELDFKLKLPKKEHYIVDPSNFLTDEEFERLLSVLSQPRDKALVMLLRETGIRIGEALSLNVGDVEITERYGKLHIRHSKTKERYVEFVKSIPYVRAWLSVHPDPKPDSPLFISLRGAEHTRLDYDGVASALRRALKRAGLKKRVHPHLFRHMVATELLSTERLPEEVVRVYMGWKHGSRMVSRYSHVSSEKANELVMKARYGIGEEKREEPKGYKECPRCGRMVPIDSKYCNYCGLVLDREELMRERELMRRVDELIELLRENPQLLDQLKKLVKK